VYNELLLCANENELQLSESGNVNSIQSKVSFKNVSYAYPNASNPSLENINFEVSIGSVVGIIGQSGAGKTTLINILTGLLNPNSGTVFIDNEDITDRVFELRKFVGYVPQQIFLIDDSLKRNIAFGISDEEIDNERIESVIKSAQLEEVVERMPLGMNTVIGERGVKLSGGQRQRIGIARALYNNPAILILDEGTSALDTETESFIMSAVANLKGSLTIILVAHRYSTLNFCDIVYKMQNGKIVGKGKLEELI
jgi:ATP-binding cassette, subfamily B, bacterial PglK